ncbi:MAG: class I SAM-dependent methyltransferase [bacterium]
MDEFADIAETYDWTELSTDDLPFYLQLAREAPGPILEIGAGTGRVTIPLARLGKPVTALDISDAMLARIRSKWQAQGDGQNLSFMPGDFRSLSMAQSFALMVAPGRVFEHAVSDSERQAAFRGCATHLSSSGILALHVWGPPSDSNFTQPEKSSIIQPTQTHGTLRFSWREERHFPQGTRTHYFRVEELDGQKRVWNHKPIEVRWFTPGDLDELGENVGLRVEKRLSNFVGRPFTPSGLNMIWVFRKK